MFSSFMGVVTTSVITVLGRELNPCSQFREITYLEPKKPTSDANNKLFFYRYAVSYHSVFNVRTRRIHLRARSRKLKVTFVSDFLTV